MNFNEFSHQNQIRYSKESFTLSITPCHLSFCHYLFSFTLLCYECTTLIPFTLPHNKHRAVFHSGSVCDSWHGVSPIRFLCFSAHTNIFECLFIFLLLLVSFGSMNWLPQAVCSTQFLLRVGKHDKCIIHKFH